jgi:AcrR family transcriptional regulator
MARKTARRKEPSQPSAPKSPRQRIIDAFMALLAEQPIEKIGLADVASGAGITLADLRDEFSSTLAIVAAHMKAIDRAVLAGIDPDMAEEPPRERLFDVLMRRLDALAHALRWPQPRTGARAQRSRDPLAAMDAHSGRHFRRRAARDAACAGACLSLCVGRAHLG